MLARAVWAAERWTSLRVLRSIWTFVDLFGTGQYGLAQTYLNQSIAGAGVIVQTVLYTLRHPKELLDGRAFQTVGTLKVHVRYT